MAAPITVVKIILGCAQVVLAFAAGACILLGLASRSSAPTHPISDGSVAPTRNQGFTITGDAINCLPNGENIDWIVVNQDGSVVCKFKTKVAPSLNLGANTNNSGDAVSIIGTAMGGNAVSIPPGPTIGK